MKGYTMDRRALLVAAVGATAGAGCLGRGAGDREQRMEILRLDRDARNTAHGDLNAHLLEAYGYLENEQPQPAMDRISEAIAASEEGKEYTSAAIELTHEIDHEGAADARAIEEQVERALTLMQQGLVEINDGLERYTAGDRSDAMDRVRSGGGTIREALNVNPPGAETLAAVLDVDIPSDWEYAEWQEP